MTASLSKTSNLLIITSDQNPLLVSPGSSSQGWTPNTADTGDGKSTSNQRSLFGRDLVGDTALSISDSISKCGIHFKDVIQPEDTTDKTDSRPSMVATYQSLNIFGIFKTMFWMAVSIGLSLMIGNFC